jgi:hypothetical protein
VTLFHDLTNSGRIVSGISSTLEFMTTAGCLSPG